MLIRNIALFTAPFALLSVGQPLSVTRPYSPPEAVAKPTISPPRDENLLPTGVGRPVVPEPASNPQHPRLQRRTEDELSQTDRDHFLQIRQTNFDPHISGAAVFVDVHNHLDRAGKAHPNDPVARELATAPHLARMKKQFPGGLADTFGLKPDVLDGTFAKFGDPDVKAKWFEYGSAR